MTSFIGSVEFYVIAAFVAAAVIAAVAKPSSKGAARTFFYAGELLPDAEAEAEAAVDCRVNERGDLEITRRGLEGVGTDGAWSLAVEIIGQDVTIRERLTAGRPDSAPVGAARATIDCLGPDRYHFHYVSEATKTDTAFYLTVRPGATVCRPLKA